jgi:phospholipid/cholesterol/gamma-HCH transport system ATP-binding protein
LSEFLRRIQEVKEGVSELLGVASPPEELVAPLDLDEPVISFRDVYLAFDRPILRGVSFDLLPGETKIVLGGSGSGKTTLLRLILGLLKPDSGRVTVAGTDVATLTEEELRPLRLRVGMVFQEGALFDSLTVAENVGFQLTEEGGQDEDAAPARVREMLGFVDLGAFYERMPSELSGGQRRRVAVARALAARPEIMLYDEPTTGLDPITASTITDLIVKVRDLDGVSSLLVTHQLRDAFNVARTFVRREGDEYLYSRIEDVSQLAGTSFLMLREGAVHFEGSPHELVTSGDPYLREFLS